MLLHCHATWSSHSQRKPSLLSCQWCADGESKKAIETWYFIDVSLKRRVPHIPLLSHVSLVSSLILMKSLVRWKSIKKDFFFAVVPTLVVIVGWWDNWKEFLRQEKWHRKRSLGNNSTTFFIHFFRHHRTPVKPGLSGFLPRRKVCVVTKKAKHFTSSRIPILLSSMPGSFPSIVMIAFRWLPTTYFTCRSLFTLIKIKRVQIDCRLATTSNSLCTRNFFPLHEQPLKVEDKQVLFVAYLFLLINHSFALCDNLYGLLQVTCLPRKFSEQKKFFFFATMHSNKWVARVITMILKTHKVNEASEYRCGYRRIGGACKHRKKLDCRYKSR